MKSAVIYERGGKSTGFIPMDESLAQVGMLDAPELGKAVIDVLGRCR